MPEKKSLAAFAVLYPLVYLVLVLCGPVAMLPFCFPLYLFVGVIDACLNLAVAAVLIALCALRAYRPDVFWVGTAAAAVGFRTMTLGQRLRFAMGHILSLASTVLLAATSHYVIAFCLLATFVSFAVFKSLVLRAHPLDATPALPSR